MDDSKKEYLESLRKQIDPEVLSRMSNAMTRDAAVSSRPSADTMREKRVLAVQERLASRRRGREMPVEKKKAESLGPLLIYGNNGVWNRIVASQFRMMGFLEPQIHGDFVVLIRSVLARKSSQPTKPVIVALGIHEVQAWFTNLVRIGREIGSGKQKAILDNLTAFLVVESRKQVTDLLGKMFGADRIISLTDDSSINREKIQQAMAPEVSG
jgi:hypothetical protein